MENNWVEIAQESLDEAAAAMRRYRFAQAMIDRDILEAGGVIRPHLYLVEDAEL